MKPSYEDQSYKELETELLKRAKKLDRDFKEEWMPYLM